MSLAHAVMGLLRVRPMTGYDLKTLWFDRSMRYFWPADQAQIYRTLDSLADRGWATARVEPGRDRPNRKVFTLTAEGEAALLKWLADPQPLPTVRDPLLVQLFCGDGLTDGELVSLLREQGERHAERRREYEGIGEIIQRAPATERQRRLWHLTLANGRAREDAYLAWLEEAIAILTADADLTRTDVEATPKGP